jgi:hypothetical protein
MIVKFIQITFLLVFLFSKCYSQSPDTTCYFSVKLSPFYKIENKKQKFKFILTITNVSSINKDISLAKDLPTDLSFEISNNTQKTKFKLLTIASDQPPNKSISLKSGEQFIRQLRKRDLKNLKDLYMSLGSGEYSMQAFYRNCTSNIYTLGITVVTSSINTTVKPR